MRTSRLMVPMVLVVAAVAACEGRETPLTPDGPDGPNGPGITRPVNLLSPEDGNLFTQNDSTIGCPAHPFRGYGFRLAFDWEDVPGAYRYAVHLKADGAQYAAVDYQVMESRFGFDWCNTFVIDRNLEGWVWRVAAIADDSTGGVDTLWSETRRYGFTPCRHADSTPCSAPPGSIR